MANVAGSKSPFRHAMHQRAVRQESQRIDSLSLSLHPKSPASQSQRLSSCLASSADPVPPAAWPDSAAFRPLHFTAATANDGGALSFRSDGRKLTRPDETGRVPQVARGNLVAALLARLGRGDKTKMAARLRPAKTSNTARGVACRRRQSNMHRESAPGASNQH